MSAKKGYIVEKQIDQNDNTATGVEMSEDASNFSDNDTDKYSIYNYLKAHPAVLLACFSGSVAVITFLSQLIVYIVNKNTLEYWNFDVAYVSFANNNLIYSAIAVIVYIAIITFATTWFLKTSVVYLERKKYYLIASLICKQHKKHCVNHKKRISRLRSKPNVDTKELDEIEESVISTQNDIDDLDKITRKLKWKARFSFIVNVIPILILMMLFGFVCAFVIVPKEDVIKCIAIFGIAQLLSFYWLFLLEQKTQINKKKIKKEISNENIADLIKEGRIKQEYPIFSLFVKGDGITNSAFVLQGVSTLLAFLILIFISVFVLTNNAQFQKEFKIVDIDGENYAVVYYADDTYYLEKAVIWDNNLIVITSKQRIISTSDISFTVQTFDKVVKIDTGEVK